MKRTYAVRKAELNINQGLKRAFKDTLSIYRSACRYIGEIVLSHWDSLKAIDSTTWQLTAVESLIHKTKDNPTPLYPEFDRLYYKMPSAIRRSAVNYALGQVSSYQTRYDDWSKKQHEAMSNGKKFSMKPPRVNFVSNACPTLYSTVYSQNECIIRIKVYIRHTWDWVTVRMPGRDLKCLAKADADPTFKPHKNPALVYTGHKFYLHFPYPVRLQKYAKLPLDEQLIMGCDLGLNHGAVVSVSDVRGRIYYRAFDPFRKKRNAINRILDRIRYIQKKSGKQKLSALYTKLDGVKSDYAKQLAHWIVQQARDAGVYGIVLERLDKMKGKGYHADRIHHWCKARIRDLVRGMAARYGIRVFLINPRNTSKLAFDGSGEVSRDPHNHTKCVFATGKQYNCDLSASYNISSRYFVREMEKTMSSEAWEAAKAEVPELSRRTRCTLSTLWKMAEPARAAA